MDAETKVGSMRLCVLGSGSEGNSTLVYTDETAFLIDAGFSAKTIEKRLAEIEFDPKRLEAILITHEHSDHIKGADVLSRRYHLPVYMTEGTAMNAVGKFKDDGMIRNVVPEENFRIGDIEVNPFSVPHDVADPVGYLVESDGRCAVNLTDLGMATVRVVEKIRRANLAVVEANHHPELLKIGPYPWHLKTRIASSDGHLSNDQCTELLHNAGGNGLKSVIFAHLSKINNNPNLVEEMGRDLFGGSDVKYEVAMQDRPGSVFNV